MQHITTEELRSGNIRVDVRDGDDEYSLYFKEGVHLFAKRVRPGTRTLRIRGPVRVWRFARQYLHWIGDKPPLPLPELPKGRY